MIGKKSGIFTTNKRVYVISSCCKSLAPNYCNIHIMTVNRFPGWFSSGSAPCFKLQYLLFFICSHLLLVIPSKSSFLCLSDTSQTANEWVKTLQSAKAIFHTSILSLSQCTTVFLKPFQILQHIRCLGELRHLGSSCRKSVWISSCSSCRKEQLVHVSLSQQPWAWQRTVIMTRAQSASTQESKQANGEKESALLLIRFGCRISHSMSFPFFSMWKRWSWHKRAKVSSVWLQVSGCNAAFLIVMRIHCRWYSRNERVKVPGKGEQHRQYRVSKESVQSKSTEERTVNKRCWWKTNNNRPRPHN